MMMAAAVEDKDAVAVVEKEEDVAGITGAT
jgi:hypothetical protein